MSGAGPQDDAPRASRARMTALFRRTLVQVIAAEVAALLLLWLVQVRYTT